MMEPGETPDVTVRRELGEETDLPIESLKFTLAVSMLVPKEFDSKELWRANIFRVDIPSSEFKVFEGAGAEDYGIEEIMQRQDLTVIAQRVLNKLFGGKLWL